MRSYKITINLLFNKSPSFESFILNVTHENKSAEAWWPDFMIHTNCAAVFRMLVIYLRNPRQTGFVPGLALSATAT